MTIWQNTGPDMDVVLSTRVRLARNFKDIAFPTSMNIADSSKVKDRTLNILKGFDEFKFNYYDFSSMSPIERTTFVERHICSKELARTPQMSAMLLSRDESVSVMINEEDHIRAQAMTVGLDYDTALKKANIIQDALDESGQVAYKEDIGYLTSCPTNLGTGMRASAMIRMPAVFLTGGLHKMNESFKKAGFTLRGIYGEGSTSVGGIMQLSNARDVADSRDEIVDKVKSICSHVIKAERAQRENLKNRHNIRVEDKISRALGVLKYAKRMPLREADVLIGDIWLGKDLGLVEGISDIDFLNLLTTVQDSTLQMIGGEEKNKSQLNITRANYIRNYLSERGV